MVELFKYAHTNKNNDINFALFSVEWVQKLFFEVFHMVNMIHEVPRKYVDQKEFTVEDKKQKKMGDAQYLEALERMEKYRREREKRKRDMMKFMQKSKNLSELGNMGFTRKPAKPMNKWWPINYGWEIEDQWYF